MGSTFLDVIDKIEYLVALGVNVVQPLPVYENGRPALASRLRRLRLLLARLQLCQVYDPAALLATSQPSTACSIAKGFAPMTARRHHARLRPAQSHGRPPPRLRHRRRLRCRLQPRRRMGRQTYYVTSPPAQFTATTRASTSGTAPSPRRAASGTTTRASTSPHQGFVGGLSFALWNADVRGYLEQQRPASTSKNFTPTASATTRSPCCSP
jgi:hypothetical protein